MKKYVYSFGGGTADGDGKMRDILGGKGAGLAEMSKAGVPVPPGSPSPPKSATLFRERQQGSEGGRRADSRALDEAGRSRWARSWAIVEIRCC